MAAGRIPLSGRLRFLFVCLTLSGTSGLIYEVVWMRKLALLFGSTTLATSLSLSIFLGGMAVGAWFFGSRATRWRSPARAYALMEVVVGVFGAASSWMLSGAAVIYPVLVQRFVPGVFGAYLLQLALTAVVLIVPTALMGGTIPVLLAAGAERESRQPGQTGSRFSALYAANTFGATAGAALTAFWLLPVAGLQRTLEIAAVLNVAAGALAWFAGRSDRLPVSLDAPSDLRPSRSGASPAIPLLLVPVVAFASGFSTLFHEVVWTRALDLVLGNSTRAFATMLTVFLIGLAGGGLTAGAAIRTLARASRKPRRWDLGQLLALSLAGVAAAVLGSSWAIGQSPEWFLRLWQHQHGSTFDVFLASLAIGGAVLLAPAFLMGLVLPVAIELGRDGRDAADRVGRYYAVNTVGCIAGAALAGLAFVPRIGMESSLITGAWINVAIAALVLATRPAELWRRAAGIAGLAAVAVALTWLTPAWDRKWMTIGPYFNASQILRGGLDNYREELASRELLFYREGRTGTVTVTERRGERNLAIDGRGEASTRALAQVLLGHAPFVTGREIKDAFVIGFGTGTTTGTLASYPIRHIDVVDLEGAVIEASRLFDSINQHPLADPRVSVHVEDARSLLALEAPASYDAIISQPSYPWVSGASKLFTEEFYMLARSRLRAGGVFAQWVQLYDIDEADVRSFLRTFSVAFPNTMVFDVGGAARELLLLGSVDKVSISWPALRAAYADPRRRTNLGKVELPDEGSLLALVLLGSGDLADILGNGPVNTDDNSLLEFGSATTLYDDTARANQQVLRQAAGDPWSFVTDAPVGRERELATAEMARGAARMHDLARALRFAQSGVDLDGREEAYCALGDVLFADHEVPGAVRAWTRGLSFAPDDTELMIRLVRYYRGVEKQKRPAQYAAWAARVPFALTDTIR